MIPRPEARSAPAEASAEPEGPANLVEVTVVEINVGSGEHDQLSFTLMPGDTFDHKPGVGFLVLLQRNNEQITVPESSVRFWSQRTFQATVPLKPFTPPSV